MKKGIKIFLLGLILLLIGAVVFVYLNKDKLYKGTTQDDTSKVLIVEPNVNLSDYTTDIYIKNAGTYTLTGALNHSVIIEAEGKDITLNLNNATIVAGASAAIAGKSVGNLTINLMPGTTNTISDGGKSEEFDSALYSNSDITITGEGVLIVNGNQTDGEGIATKNKNITINSGTIKITAEDDGINAGGDGGTIAINGGMLYIDAKGDGIDSNKDAVINGGTIFIMGSDKGGNAAIDTDTGYTINGGTVVALGTDMLESPLDTSNQKTLCLALDEVINENSVMGLLDSSDNTIISFQSTKKFKTVIISTNKLTNLTYSLYKDGTNSNSLVNGVYSEVSDGLYTKGAIVSANSNTSFPLISNVTTYGNTKPNEMP